MLAPALLVLHLVMPALLAGQVASDWPGRVLLTSDDGVDAPGLRALVTVFSEFTETYVAAPSENRSGASNFLGSLATRELTVHRRESARAEVSVYAVDGYPGDAVVWALRGLLADRPPDLVISGINGGPNAGDSWIASGTIGAARMAAYFGVPALAVSGVDTSDPDALRGVATWVAQLSRSSLVRALEPGDYLVVNLPAIAIEEMNGIVLAPLDKGMIDFRFVPGEDDRWSFAFRRLREPDPSADWAALGRGLVVITPMRIGEVLEGDRFGRLVEELRTPGR